MVDNEFLKLMSMVRKVGCTVDEWNKSYSGKTKSRIESIIDYDLDEFNIENNINPIKKR